MAKAVATCTCKVCGATFQRSTIKATRRDADSWEKWAAQYYDVCDACEQNLAESKAQELSAESQSHGLPELTGSAKQIVWADKIRKELLPHIDDALRQMHSFDDCANDEQKKILKYVDRAADNVRAIASASWWIDNRLYSDINGAISLLVKESCKLAKNDTANMVKPADTAEEDYTKRASEERETIITPENQTEGTATVIVKTDANDLIASYPAYNEQFVSVCRGYGMRYEPRTWKRHIVNTDGDIVDRAAELVNKLLRSGFAVKTSDAKVREMAVNATYTPARTRWIKRGKTDDEFSVMVETEDQFNALKSVNGVRGWTLRDDKDYYGKLFVPISRWAEIMDFADMHDYKFSPVAQEMVDEAIRRKAAAVKVSTPAQVVNPADGRLASILDSATDVLPDLEDDDGTAN